MEQEYTVSVIMSEYNTEKKILKESINSILQQTYSNFEFIIVNDGSSTNLQDIVDEINDTRLKIIDNKVNLGLPKSLNKAIERAKGEYLVRMDTDDIANKRRIETLVDFITTYPEYSVVGSSVNILTETGEKIPKVFKGEIDKNLLMNRVFPVHPSVIMKKSEIINIGMYKTQNVKRCEDFVLWGDLLLNNKRIYVLSDILLDYRVSIYDYKKRRISTRIDEVRNRIKYYKLFKANTRQYLSIFKSVISGIVPGKIMAIYHRNKLM